MMGVNKQAGLADDRPTQRATADRGARAERREPQAERNDAAVEPCPERGILPGAGSLRTSAR